jgi:anti-anti-sigma regulatory factor
MTTNPVWIKVNPEHIDCALLEDAVEQVNGGQSEVVLDFSSVLRIDGNAVEALEKLAGLAGARSVRIVLRAVNADIYRVLKILGLTGRFGFIT